MTSRRWVRTRLLGGPWLACAVVVPVVLAVAASLTGHASAEDDLTARTRTVLAEAGVQEADVSFEGVVGTVVVRLRALPDAMSSREVQDVVDGVRGARSITVQIPRRPGRRTASPDAIAEPTPAPGDDDDTSDDDTSGATSGATPDDTAGDAPDVDCASPQEQVDALLGPDKVAFGNDGAVLPESQRAEVEAVAAYVVRCRLAVNAVGHTADRAPARSRIGVERARAVAAVLREAGALVVRVQGKRGSQPLADNDTQAGRLLNRYADVVVR